MAAIVIQLKTALGVYTDALESAVGRLGVAVGREFDRGNVYFKASALHEFGGSGGVTMLAANGESYGKKKITAAPGVNWL